MAPEPKRPNVKEKLDTLAVRVARLEVAREVSRSSAIKTSWDVLASEEFEAGVCIGMALGLVICAVSLRYS